MEASSEEMPGSLVEQEGRGRSEADKEKVEDGTKILKCSVVNTSPNV